MKLLLTLTVLLTTSVTWADTTYTVRSGDTLLSIADRTIGIVDNKKDPRRFEFAKRIRAKNPQIKNPNSLSPGETLIIPDYPTSAAKPVTRTNPPRTAPERADRLAPTVATPLTPPVVTLPPTSATTQNPVGTPAASVAQEPTPTPAPAHEVAHHDEGHGDFIAVQPRFQMATLKAKNLATSAETTVKTKAAGGVDLLYGKAWGSRAQILAQLGYTYTEFKTLDGGATMNHMTESQKFFGLGLAYELLPSLHLDVMATAADRTFLVPGTTTILELKSMMIPGADINISWDAIRTGQSVLGFSAIGEYIGELQKDGIKYKSSLEPLAALYWKSKREGHVVNYRASLTYKKGHQSTTVSDQKEELWIAGFTVYFPL